MRFVFFLLFFSFTLQSQNFDFISFTKNDNYLIKEQIETLNSVISKSLRKNEFDRRLFLIKRSYLLRKGEIQILSSKKSFEITLSSKEILLDKNSMLKIAQALLIKYLDLPDDYIKKTEEIIPNWVAFAFIYRSEQILKKPFITLPYYPYTRALFIYPCSFNHEILLKDNDLKEDFILDLKSEMAWAIISSIKKSTSIEDDFIDELKSFAQQVTLPISVQDNKIIEKKCLPGNSLNIMKLSSLNYFYPAPPRHCEESILSTIESLLNILKKEYDNSEVEAQEKNKAIKDAITEFDNLQKYLPYFSRISFSSFNNKFKSFKHDDYEKIKAFLENTTINDMFDKDKYVYELMKKSEEKFLSPGKKYTLLLEYLSNNDEIPVSEIIK